ncbi:hypothetical protein V8E55_005000 [Tylopilus felleus]
MSSPGTGGMCLHCLRAAASQWSSSTFEPHRWRDIRVVTSFVSSQMSSFPQISFLYTHPNWTVSASLKHPTLTGETNLKIKQASPSTTTFTPPPLVTSLHGSFRSEQLCIRMKEFLPNEGVPRQIPLSPDQILLRGAQLRNTPWIYGIVVFTGYETKLLWNLNMKAVLIKRTAVEEQVNIHIIFLFGLLASSLGSIIGMSINTISGSSP